MPLSVFKFHNVPAKFDGIVNFTASDVIPRHIRTSVVCNLYLVTEMYPSASADPERIASYLSGMYHEDTLYLKEDDVYAMLKRLETMGCEYQQLCGEFIDYICESWEQLPKENRGFIEGIWKQIFG